ncbi:4-oxalocrotonate decarboxylase [Trypanosoma rangeli]|uniref:4-oxalocrotonate decarboxylase n=1 Tax=Trypanosoma rangeli TaxID=5698 RepID=A0A422NIG2_TRYRA|nr:4-oxalocrotonate decarboxylase [Trypanosoma rangeli]RNF05247.1 4-oxalocrotonate decarboxylase [Trypanosoma rangeli]|eukprot:RNF05247.1 4-oxalocrotonate decarboxylase [Trypanosoma rangeli]
MFSYTLRRLAVSKTAIESYMDYLRNADRDLPALSEILPRHQANSKNLLEFHSILCEVMQENGFNFMGIKVIPPSSAALQCLRWTDVVCVPVFSIAFQQLDLSVKQHRIQFIEPLFVLRLGRDATSQLTLSAAATVCDVFRPGIELTGSRFPFYPPHATGFAADLGGCISVRLGEETELVKASLDTLGNHSFVMTRKNEPLQVGSGKNCLGGPSAAVASAVAYAVSIGRPLRTGNYVFCTGVGTRSPAIPGDYQVNYGVYGTVSCSLS